MPLPIPRILLLACIMSEPLRSFCLACARFGRGDPVGELLAMVAAAPYFALYHAGAVLHARRCASACGMSGPLPAAAPAVCAPAVACFDTSLPILLYCCRELHMAFVLLGLLFTSCESHRDACQ